MGEMEEEMGHAACLFPARRAGTGRTERPIDVSRPKPLASWAEKGEAPDWGRTQPTIPQAPREPTREVALPPTSWGLYKPRPQVSVGRTEQPGQPGERPGLGHLLRIPEHGL